MDVYQMYHFAVPQNGTYGDQLSFLNIEHKRGRESKSKAVSCLSHAFASGGLDI